MVKKILAFLLFGLAILLVLAQINLLPSFIYNVRTLFSSEVDDFMMGEAIGGIAAYFIILAVIVGLVIGGKKLLRKKRD